MKSKKLLVISKLVTRPPAAPSVLCAGSLHPPLIVTCLLETLSSPCYPVPSPNLHYKLETFCPPPLSSTEVAQLLEAADFAARKHQRQRRKDPEGTPYINHPIGGRSAGGATAVASRGWGPGRERGGRAAPRAPSGYLALCQAQFVFKTHSDLGRSAWLFPMYSGHPKKKKE